MIHRYWQGAPDPDADRTGRALLDLNPDTELMDWSPLTIPADAVELIAATRDRVIPGDVSRHAANIVRLVVLRDIGGVWIDHDARPLAPFRMMPSPATAAHGRGSRCNCWMSFPKEHPAVKLALDTIAHQSWSGPPARSMLVSGETLLDRLWPGNDVVARVPVRVDRNGREDPLAPAFIEHAQGSLHEATAGR